MHAVLQSVFAFPLLVGRLVRMISVPVLFVQGLGQAGREKRLVLGKAARNIRRGSLRGCLFGGTGSGHRRLAGAATIFGDGFSGKNDRLVPGRRSIFVIAPAEAALRLGRGGGLAGAVEAALGTVAAIVLEAAAPAAAPVAKASALPGWSLAGAGFGHSRRLGGR